MEQNEDESGRPDDPRTGHTPPPETEPAPTPLVPLPAQADARPLPHFDPVPLRPRHDGWTPAKQRAYVEHLAETLSPEAAAALVGMSVQSARALRRRPGGEGF